MTNPLTWSGIKYIAIWPNCYRYDELNGKPMVDSANPFSVLKDSDNSSLSVFDLPDLANEILVGEHFDLEVRGQGRKGILDVLIFPLVSRVLLYYMVKQSTPAILKLGAGIVGLPLEIARHIIAFALAVAVSPLVFLVHVAFKLKNTLANLSLKQPQQSIFNYKEENFDHIDDSDNMLDDNVKLPFLPHSTSRGIHL